MSTSNTKPKKQKKSKPSTTPDIGTVVVFESFGNWFDLKVAWDDVGGVATNKQLYARCGSNVAQYGVTNPEEARPSIKCVDGVVWTFNTTKPLNVVSVAGAPVELSCGDKVIITHRRHIVDGKIYLSPDKVLVVG